MLPGACRDGVTPDHEPKLRAGLESCNWQEVTRRAFYSYFSSAQTNKEKKLAKAL